MRKRRSTMDCEFHGELMGHGDFSGMLHGHGKLTVTLPPPPPEPKKPAEQVDRWRWWSRVAFWGAGLFSVGALICWIWLWYTGASAPSMISMGAKVFSFAMIGSLLSIGGISLVSMKGEISLARKQLDKCPFEPLRNDDNGRPEYGPGSPDFCCKCPLGIDLSRNHAEMLIHVCKRYPELHSEWKSLPAAQEYIKHHGG